MNIQSRLLHLKPRIIQELIHWIQCESVFDEATIGPNQPFGHGVAHALDYIAKLAKQDGFDVDTCDGYCTEISYGQGEEIVMVLGHADVVPVGNGWSTPPFAGVVKDEKIYGRGTSDDKGPTLAAYYALKLIKESNLALKRKIRLVIGGNEERGSACLQYYFHTLKKPHPTYGFTPDAAFPLIYGEKGIMGYQYEGELNDPILIMLEGGIVANSVPEEAKATLHFQKDLQAEFLSFLKQYQLEGQYTTDQKTIELFIKGKAAHGSTPMKGVNALVYLLHFLARNTSSPLAHHFSKIFTSYFGEDLNIDFSNELMGRLTVNVGIGEYRHEHYRFVLNIRYPNSVDGETLVQRLNAYALHRGRLLNDSKPLFVDPESTFVKTLWQAYQQVTNDQISKPYTIGGGTYARQTVNTVAFGMDFPNNSRGSGNIHSPDECLHIQDLLDGIHIYYEALLQLVNL